ncbi:MAG TPA: hypothetical protein VOB72_23010 [Candidatus Dormibacteraeota bacterium]|nr:hypothetical protein [Candidatus Dormibacteraeota bacterium]
MTRRVRVSIERLVLEGVPHADRHRVVLALEAELTRRLAGGPPAPAGVGPEAIGRHAAGAVWGEVQRRVPTW